MYFCFSLRWLLLGVQSWCFLCAKEKGQKDKKRQRGDGKGVNGSFLRFIYKRRWGREGGEKVMVYRNFRLGSLGVCNFFLGGVVFFLLLGVL